MTHRQALQGFPGTRQVSTYKNDKINDLQQFLALAGKGQLGSAFSVNSLQYAANGRRKCGEDYIKNVTLLLQHYLTIVVVKLVKKFFFMKL
jgi:hypothetical protein